MKMKFIGEHGSMGLSTGMIYDVEILLNEDTRRIVLSWGRGKCPYASWEAVARNWQSVPDPRCQNIDELGLSPKTYKLLTSAGILTVQRALDTPIDTYFQIKGFNTKHMEELVKKLPAVEPMTVREKINKLSNEEFAEFLARIEYKGDDRPLLQAKKNYWLRKLNKRYEGEALAWKG